MTAAAIQEMVWDISSGSQKHARPIAKANATSILEPDGTFMRLLKGALDTDTYWSRNRYLRRGDDDGLVYLGRLLYVPPSLRTHVMREAHEPTYSGHLGVDKTTASVKRRFF